jgi:hypothetical protein
VASLRTDIRRMLLGSGAVLHRDTGHQIWRLNGMQIVVSCTPSHSKALHDIRSFIRRAQQAQEISGGD